jgi:hypothetical protein
MSLTSWRVSQERNHHEAGNMQIAWYFLHAGFCRWRGHVLRKRRFWFLNRLHSVVFRKKDVFMTEITLHVWDPYSYFRVHKIPALTPNRSRVKPVPIFWPHIFKIHINIITGMSDKRRGFRSEIGFIHHFNTRNSELQVTTASSLISTLHKPLQHRD